MKLYLDASALIKAFLEERGSAEVREALAAAEGPTTSAVAYAELRATFARSLRDGRFDAAQHTAALEDLDDQWLRFVFVDLDDECLCDAGSVVDRRPPHALRALDSIHLASALRIATGDPTSVTYACWDLRLWRAARDEGFTMLPSTEPD